MHTGVLIVGGGLSGLSLAAQLQTAGVDWQLFEARSRWGGRVLTQTLEGQAYDLGPSWFWPAQPRIAALIEDLKLTRFDQAYHGDLLYQDENGDVHRGRGAASMQGSYRLKDGLGQIVNSLENRLPSDRLHLNSPVTGLTKQSDDIMVETESSLTLTADQVVLAIPPRVALNISFEPALSAQSVTSAGAIPTWMAGHAKVIATYRTPFWQEQGLSGDAISRKGPLAEIHDASPFNNGANNDGPGALFGFVGTPPALRMEHTKVIMQSIRSQLGELFGSEAAEPKRLQMQDWATEPYTSTTHDQTPLNQHPAYGRPQALQNLFDGRLHFGSTEMGDRYGGYLEGALEVSDDLARRLILLSGGVSQ